MTSLDLVDVQPDEGARDTLVTPMVWRECVICEKESPEFEFDGASRVCDRCAMEATHDEAYASWEVPT
jgi:hypothetical protein